MTSKASYITTQIQRSALSGSPCFNDFWEVAALHFTGIPNTNKNGEWLTKKR
jgi:hypothetical protein